MEYIIVKLCVFYLLFIYLFIIIIFLFSWEKSTLENVSILYLGGIHLFLDEGINPFFTKNNLKRNRIFVVTHIYLQTCLCLLFLEDVFL